MDEAMIQPEYTDLRIVCLSCMRDVRILHAERNASRRAIFVRVQCHGEDRLAFANDTDQGRPGRPVIWDDLYDLENVEERAAEEERYMLEAAERLALYRDHLSARSKAGK